MEYFELNPEDNTFSNIVTGSCPSIVVKLGDGQLRDSFIKKTKVYMRDSESDIYYLQF